MDRELTPELVVGRLVDSDGHEVGFLGWDNTTVTKTELPVRPLRRRWSERLMRLWRQRREGEQGPTTSQGESEVIPSIHYRLVMTSGPFAGDWEEFYEPLRAEPEVFGGFFAYKGIRFRYETLDGSPAAAVTGEHFADWP